MLNDFSDRGPEPPRWKAVLVWAEIGVVAGLIAVNLARGVMTGAWNW